MTSAMNLRSYISREISKAHESWKMLTKDDLPLTAAAAVTAAYELGRHDAYKDVFKKMKSDD